MEITLLAYGIPQLLDRSSNPESPIETKLREISDNPFANPNVDIAQDRRRMCEAWEWWFVRRWEEHFEERFSRKYHHRKVILTWAHKDTDPLDIQFEAAWRQVMWESYESGSYQSDYRFVFLYICHIGVRGDSMGPLCNVWQREISNQEMIRNIDYLKGGPYDFDIKPNRPELINEGMPNILPMLGRSEGGHVSSAVSAYAKELGLYKSKGITLTTTWSQFGCIWEDAIIDYLQRIYPDEYTIPGELELDGIYGTPDAYRTRDGVRKVVEIKLPWMSSKNDPWPKRTAKADSFFRFRMQIMAYCKMAYTDLAELHVNFINGDWKSFCPTYKVWGLRFTKGELNQNWALVRGKCGEQLEDKRANDRARGDK